MKTLLRSTFTAIAVVLFALTLSATLGVSAPAQAQDLEENQCLSREDCRELRAALKQLTRQIKPLRRQFRQLRQEIRDTPEGDKRDELIKQAREIKRELKQLRRARRPILRRARHGCRRECFPT